MVSAIDCRRQSRACTRLAEDCDDHHLAEQLRAMAASLAAKADDIEQPPSEPAMLRLRSTSVRVISVAGAGWGIHIDGWTARHNTLAVGLRVFPEKEAQRIRTE